MSQQEEGIKFQSLAPEHLSQGLLLHGRWNRGPALLCWQLLARGLKWFYSWLSDTWTGLKGVCLMDKPDSPMDCPLSGCLELAPLRVSLQLGWQGLALNICLRFAF